MQDLIILNSTNTHFDNKYNFSETLGMFFGDYKTKLGVFCVNEVLHVFAGTLDQMCFPLLPEHL